jgi:hypothetical protein
MVKQNTQATLPRLLGFLWGKAQLRLRARQERQLYLFDTKPYELKWFWPGRPLTPVQPTTRLLR